MSSGPRSRFRGALLGVASGDALGAPFEGAPPGAVDVEQVASTMADLRHTDDTAMTIVLAESLLERGGFDGEQLAQAFRVAYEAEPWRGYGAGPPQIFAALAQGAPWDEPARRLFHGEGSYGNGAAMRAAPAALFHHPDIDAAAELGRSQAVVTHAHPLGVDGAGVFAAAVAAALVAPSAQEPEAVLEPALAAAHSLELREQMEHVHALLPGAAPEEVVSRVGNGITAAESVPAAIASALLNRNSVADAIGFALCLGGDTDTIAAMAGAISGGLHGEAGIPEEWVARLEARDRLIELADALFDRSTRRSA